MFPLGKKQLKTRENISVQSVQINLCQKLLFLHQLNLNMTTNSSPNYMKIPSSNLGRACCVQKLFLTFRTIFVHNIFSPCSEIRRVSDKELPVLQVKVVARSEN